MIFTYEGSEDFKQLKTHFLIHITDVISEELHSTPAAVFVVHQAQQSPCANVSQSNSSAF